MRQFTRTLDMRYNPKPYDFEIQEPSHKVPLCCIFLCQFDVKKGNTLIWSKKSTETSDISLGNIEFKCIPSGIHELEKDVVSFVIPKGENLVEVYYGVSCFQQNGQSLSRNVSHVDRGKVQMFSLGVIVDASFRYKGVSKSKFYDWKPNQFISATEYIDDLQELLSHWLKRQNLGQDFSLFENYFEANRFKADSAMLSSPILQHSWQNAGKFTTNSLLQEKHPHMLESLSQWLEYLGPLMFPLWKACITRQRVLIITGNGVSFEKTNSLVYCLSILSLIPRIISDKLKDSPLQPLYCIGISDIDDLERHVAASMSTNDETYEITGFIACTGDEILESRSELYDVCLKIHGRDALPEITTSNGDYLKATPHELELYEKLVSNSLGYQLSQNEKEKVFRLVEPTTWSQYLIDGFYWWATAGYMRPSFHEPEDKVIADLDRDNLEIVISLVGYFHEKTLLLYNSLKQVVEASTEDTVVVSPIFLATVGLDCFSSGDYAFLNKVCQKWFDRELLVRNVDCTLLC
ncbi:Anr2p [Lachancea thermotolerans CBS 6340]|uniref:KLTH0D08030p n=1 Tax=Lachancea thermotolerans (strain ATCC 56472 / CBS 6340 / NRRL Y-8284) TaxID=559295 RepID=C5DGT2_LACTC|nr:KLTH0D08030p [Lachancea thermotolerans CBS 6340]CAR22624.1 KLTH0D08030p [Lachancea thermotolerans CBS 6340]